jgi:putative transposase
VKQARFHSVALDQEHFWAAMLCVERNPVRAGLVEHAGQWPWSSAQARLGMAANGLLNLVRWRSHWDATRWSNWLASHSRTAALEERIRHATLSGFPLRSQDFRDELRQRPGIKTEPGKPGRRKKSAQIQSIELLACGDLAS